MKLIGCLAMSAGGGKGLARTGTMRGIVNCFIVEMLLLTGVRAEEFCYLNVGDTPVGHKVNAVYVRDGKGGIARTIAA